MKVQRQFKVPLRKQSRLSSAVEAVVNTLIGLSVSIAANVFLFYVYDIQASLTQVFHVAGWMTLISVVRSYLVRRAWNAEFWLRINWHKPFGPLKPRTKTITRFADVPTMVGQPRIPPETDRLIETRLKQKAFGLPRECDPE